MVIISPYTALKYRQCCHFQRKYSDLPICCSNFTKPKILLEYDSRYYGEPQNPDPNTRKSFIKSRISTSCMCCHCHIKLVLSCLTPFT